MISSRDVTAATFTTVKWREGYEIDEVTELLAAVARTQEAYETGQTVPDMVTAKRLKFVDVQPTKFREGWDKVAVDAFFREARDTLANYEQGI